MSTFRGLALILLLSWVGGCIPYMHQHLLAPQPARLGAELNRNEHWRQLPAPSERTVVAVYKFRDQTGQYKPQTNGSSFSTAVTQGATSILIRALDESGWFEPIERENIGNLLNERKIIRSTREEFSQQTGRPQPGLAPLLFAGIILEGGIISYDSNIITGGGGLRYFGAGASGQYRQDRVTVYLRAISTSSGRIFRTVYTSKTILSQQVDAGVFQFVSFKHLLETETGFTYNEPSEMAVKEAIEKAVQALIYEGFNDHLWSPRDTAEQHGPGRQAYLREKSTNLDIDVLGRETYPRRPNLSIGLSGALQHYVGDYSSGLNRPGLEASLRYRLGDATSLFINAGRGQLAAGAGGQAFSQTFNYAEAGLLLRLLPQDVLTPYLLAGGGLTGRTRPTAEQPRLLPHLLAGAGAEYLLTPHLGLNVGLDVHYYLSDQLDGLATGRYNDYYLAGRAGISLYLGRQPRRNAQAR
ncbi:CsgG/HfaB family protein [Hymenobacter sp. BT559]|uniref:CsgG/HfaB family protein n=1 Tax=Hymenobacter sp. BT559 TaxID=2795729 RepID=UPI0018EE10B4|nr:CsgG/HfaB family protein [Hymenobacter sp. BT559]MBJ6143985.1 curli production assembly/transport component CsgG [Hymenobacter sp. BT559]